MYSEKIIGKGFVYRIRRKEDRNQLSSGSGIEHSCWAGGKEGSKAWNQELTIYVLKLRCTYKT